MHCADLGKDKGLRNFCQCYKKKRDDVTTFRYDHDYNMIHSDKVSTRDAIKTL